MPRSRPVDLLRAAHQFLTSQELGAQASGYEPLEYVVSFDDQYHESEGLAAYLLASSTLRLAAMEILRETSFSLSDDEATGLRGRHGTLEDRSAYMRIDPVYVVSDCLGKQDIREMYRRAIEIENP